jgi:hypothetical protein
MKDDLNALSPVPAIVTVGGKEISIAPLKVRQLQPVLSALGPALRDGFAQGFANVADWLLFFEAHTERVINAVASATDLKRDFVGELEPRELMELAFVVVEVNRDFFTRQVSPAIERLNQTLEKLGVTQPNTDGLTSPPTPDIDPTKLPS